MRVADMLTIRKLLVANRSEIAIRVFRSATELGIRTVAIYSHEDRYALHRFKADEAYRIGRPGEPIRSYLDIAGIVSLAKEIGADAIHPGYGFLSERPEFARACAEAGIKFVGPSVHCLEALGDKTAARNIAIAAGVPVLGGTQESIETVDEARIRAAEIGFPVMIKAAKGGGGRGMRAVRTAAEFDAAFESARNEARTAFGSPEVFIEKFIGRAKHIEVQLLGDHHGNRIAHMPHLADGDHRRADARTPDLQLLDSSGTECIACRQHNLFSLAREIGRKLANRRCLARAIHTNNENDERFFRLINGNRRSNGAKHAFNLAGQHVLDFVRFNIFVETAFAHRLADARCHRHAKISLDEDVFEIIQHGSIKPPLGENIRNALANGG